MKRRLTRNQRWVVDELRRQGFHFIAHESEDNWRRGKRFHIDDRVKPAIIAFILRRHNYGNIEAQKEE